MNTFTLNQLRSLTWGKTHYFDPDTCRFFGSRFGSLWRGLGPPVTRPAYRGSKARVAVYTNRFVVGTESVKPPHGPREYHVLIVDLQAWTVVRLTAETNKRAREAAARMDLKEIRKYKDPKLRVMGVQR